MSTIHWTDSNITESSGLAYSRKWANIAYTNNDENGPIYVVDLTTGDTVGKLTVADRTMVDPESMSIDFKGGLWLADIGNNDPIGDPRDDVRVYTRGEPGPGHYETKPFTRYILKYPSGTPHNAETFITWPDGKKQIISKVASGVVYQLPTTLKTGATNTMTAVFGPDAALNLVSDAVVSQDGRWVFLLRQGQLSTIYVFNTSWTQVGTISMSAMTKPEGIAITQNGKALWVCDDDGSSGGAVQKVNIPGTWCPAGATKYDDDTTVTPAADPAPAPPVNPCA